MNQTPTAPASVGPKNYVFVDEYNRHKRLKVMRACDGCRKRKIRCDGALQNGPWPCGACSRLKLKCVPPTLDQEDDEQPSPPGTSISSQLTFETPFHSTPTHREGSLPAASAAQQWTLGVATTSTFVSPTSAPAQRDVDAAVYSSQLYGQQLRPGLVSGRADGGLFTSTAGQSQYQSGPAGLPSLHRSQTAASNSSGGDPQEVDATVRELSEQMGDLSIDLTSVAPYIANEKKNLAETPAVEEVEVLLPPSVGTDSSVRIPPEMMPSEERALDYFGYFFDYVHPYVPVLNRRAFYEQWRNARHSISPLILEGIFANVARYLEEPIEVRRWLALAARHEESFKDVPRLSTVQALLILTKAREFIPKRGYYYRSWMAAKFMTSMAMDVGLHEHCDHHRQGNRCTLTSVDCTIRIRTWQTLLLVELAIGAPQGRTDFAVDIETVDFSVPAASPELDEFEYKTSRRTSFFTQVVRNVKHTNTLWQTMRRLKKEWALDSQFTSHNNAIQSWLKTLPHDMQIRYPDDSRAPWLGGDHYVAYLHIYHHLAVIMHHRPQLQMLLEKADSSFQTHLDICNESAALICRLQEALYRDFDLHGLQFMQRGIGFTIYCILTCAMLHLATITSPDPTVNSRARNYFTRHMRILERCTSSATPEVQVQIHALREAFSHDTSQPFELKQSLGMRSPSIDSKSSPPDSYSYAEPDSKPPQASMLWQNVQGANSSRTLSPASEYNQPFDHHNTPQSLSYDSSSFGLPAQQAYASSNLHRVTSAPQTTYALQPIVSQEPLAPAWNPSGIFSQWNTAFGAPAQAPPPPPLVHSHSASAPSSSVPPQPAFGYQQLYSSQMPSNAASVIPEATPAMPMVTPIMWQDAFSTAYATGHGQKRYREDTSKSGPYDPYQKRRG